MSETLPRPVHDPEALWAARYAVRESFLAVRRLRQADSMIRETLDRLDALCSALTLELESNEPELPLAADRLALSVGRE